MTRNPLRLRALAVTSLAAIILLSDLVIVRHVRRRARPTRPRSSRPTQPEHRPRPLPSDAGPASDATPTAGADPADAPGAAAETASLDSSPSSGAAADVVPASSVVIAFARSHLRAHYRHFGTGPSSFDCSGLMWRVFKEAGLSGKVTSRSARGIYVSYRARGLASRRNPQVGDLVVWGRGSHVGVYIGHGYAISALVQGVRVHRIRAMFTPFTAYLHTRLSSMARPAWELELAKHLRSLRHTTRTVTLRDVASRAGTVAGRLRSGTRLVVLAKRRDGAGHHWLKVLTFGGKSGWLPATATAR